MITKNKNPKYQYISRILLIPVLFVLIFTFAVKADEFIHTPTVELDKKVTVVIDAGHGGEDKGAINGDIHEKDLNLALAKRIKELNTNSNIEIVLSRDGDNILPVTERTIIADKANADLFISLHTAASPNKNQQGIEAFVAKNNNGYSNESKALATLLLNKLSNIYITDKSIKTRSMPIYVLEKNNRPSVVLENGYITNEKDKSFFSQESNRDKLAKAILQSIEDYFNKKVVIKNITMDTVPTVKKVKSVTVAYEDGTKETLTEEEYKKRNQPKVEKMIKLSKVDTIKVNNTKVESVFFIDGKELPKGTMPIEVNEISSIKVVDDGNGKKEVYIEKKVSNYSTSPQNDVTVLLRPSNSLVLKGQKTNGEDPLFIINGKEHTKEEMSAYEPNQIESISVLKGDAAIAKYGEKGKNGVVVVTLKK